MATGMKYNADEIGVLKLNKMPKTLLKLVKWDILFQVLKMQEK